MKTTIPAEPLARFTELFERAQALPGPYPHAVTLASADADGWPSARVVLLKSFDAEGFVVYTNLMSQKGRELLGSGKAALCFYWQPLGIQVRVVGTVEEVSPAESDSYFASRPRGSQLGAWASQQSARLESREVLDHRVEQLRQQYANSDVPRPPHWGGLRVHPRSIEFWHEREDRLHEREIYRFASGTWTKSLLYP